VKASRASPTFINEMGELKVNENEIRFRRATPRWKPNFLPLLSRLSVVNVVITILGDFDQLWRTNGDFHEKQYYVPRIIFLHFLSPKR
jgi:hypothetical protein